MVEKIFLWHLKRAEQGYVESQCWIGNMFDKGEDIEEDKEEAFKWFMKAAEKGYAPAQYKLGYMYYNGIGIDKDRNKSYCWYLKSAEQGHIESQYWVGYMLDKGEGIKEDRKEAYNWYMKAAQQGHLNAQYKLRIYFGEYNYKFVEKTHIKTLREKAEQGIEDAQLELGNMYENGLEVDQDYKEALSWYMKAAELMSEVAVRKVGEFYSNGYGVEADSDKAFEWYMKAEQGWGSESAVDAMSDMVAEGKLEEFITRSEHGDTDAQLKLGYIYEMGIGVSADFQEALNWYMKAAEQGDSNGQYNVGMMYRDSFYSEIIDQDYKEAIKWLSMAAKQGHDDAQYFLGDMYLKGNGVKQNKYTAFEWFKKAADSGEMLAILDLKSEFGITENSEEAEIEAVRGNLLLELGNMYYNGEGVKKNYLKAAEWYQKAVEHGNEEAKSILDKFGKWDENSILYVHRGTISCQKHDHNIISVTAIFLGKSDKIAKLTVNYCQDCRKFFIDEVRYEYYRKIYGYLIGNVRFEENGKVYEIDGENLNDSLAAKSPLMLCGYTVNQRDNYSDEERQYIISRMIIRRNLSKSAIARYLSFFIKRNGRIKTNRTAVKKWKKDLAFTLKFDEDKQRKYFMKGVEKWK